MKTPLPAPSGHKRRGAAHFAPGLALSVAAMCALPGAGLADRHCNPVVDSYYIARSLVADQTASCVSRRGRALEELAATMRLAVICDCPAAVETIEALTGGLGSAADCTEAQALVWSADEAIKSDVEECHN